MEVEFKTNDHLKKYIHGLHNYMRNNGFGYGKTALDTFNTFYGLKLIEPNLSKFELDEDVIELAKFSNIIKFCKKRKDCEFELNGESLITYIEDVLKCVDKKFTEIMRNYILYFVPIEKASIKEPQWYDFMMKMNAIPVGNKIGSVNMNSKTYEYFIGRDQTAISELGAYFTDRHITEFVFKMLDPSLSDKGKVKTMIDPFGGSGGFTLGYANYISKKYEDKISTDEKFWKKNVNSIYHTDVEKSVVNMTGLEIFAICGIFPSPDNFWAINAFKCEYDEITFDYVISNPPYGGDKLTKDADQYMRDGLLSYLKKLKDSGVADSEIEYQINEIKELNAEFKSISSKDTVNLKTCSILVKEIASKYDLETINDKEGCSLLLLMGLLKKNGVCCAVLKEGVFFDNKYSKLRKALCYNYKISSIISLPQNSFENTSTKTSIIIFQEGIKTDNINFYELIVDAEKEDVIEKQEGRYVMTKIKGEIISVKSILKCTVSIEDISKPTIVEDQKGKEKERYDYSFNWKNYVKKIVKCGKGYVLTKLKELCTFKKGTTLEKTSIISDNVDGIYKIPIIGSGKIQGYTDKFNLSGHNCLLSSSGALVSKNCCKIVYDDTHATMEAFIIKMKNDEDYVKKYLFHYMFNNYDALFREHAKGSVQIHTSVQILNNIEIPVPIDIKTISKDLDNLHELHKNIMYNTSLIPEKEKHICRLMDNLIIDGTKDVDFKIHILKDIIAIKHGNVTTAKITNTGEYPYYNSSTKNPCGTHNDYCFDGDKYLLYVKGGGNSKKKVSDTHALGLNFMVKGKVSTNPGVYKLELKDEKINVDYLHYLMLVLKPQIQADANYSTGLGGTDMDKFRKLELKFLNDDIMKEHRLQELFDEVDKLKSDLDSDKMKYKLASEKLFGVKEEDCEAETESTKDDITEPDITSDEIKCDVEVKTSKVKKVKKVKKPEYEIVTYKKTDYIKLDKELYIIKSGEPYKLFALLNEKGKIIRESIEETE